MKNKFLFLSGLILFLLLSGCREEIDFTDFSQLKSYKSDILGIVTAENGTAVEGATVTLNGAVRVTDKNGVYLFNDVEVDSRHTVAKIQKDGFFDGIKVFSAGRESKIQLRTILLKKDFNKSFNGGQGGTITSESITIDFPANAIVVEDTKVLYTGEVSVAIKYLDPEDRNVYDQMPGDLSGINSQNNLAVLNTYGMVAVELRATNGAKLNIATGSKAKMTAVVPSSLLSNAPSTIPLWYFDEATGFWKEEGFATLSGNKYTGEVSHFSYWNYDSQNPSIILNGRVLDQNGLPVSGLDVRVYAANEWGGHGYTNPDGTFSGPVAKDLPLTIVVSTTGVNGCQSQIVYTSSIGPFSNDATLPDIIVTVELATTYHVHANVINCAGNPVQNGYVEVDMGLFNKYLFTIVNGAVSGNIISCVPNPSFIYTAVDLDALVQSPEAASLLLLDTDLGIISACGLVADHLILNIPDLSINQTIEGTAVNIFSDTYGFLSATNSMNTKFQMLWDDDDVGNFNVGTFNVISGSLNISAGQDPNTNEYIVETGTVTITAGGGNGSTIEGTYNVNMIRVSDGFMLPINGSFKKKFN